MNDGKAAEMGLNDLGQVHDVSQRLAAEVAIYQVEIGCDHRVGSTVVVHLECGNADEGGRVAPEQVDEGEGFRFVSGHSRVELNGSGAFLELVPALGVKPLKQIND